MTRPPGAETDFRIDIPDRDMADLQRRLSMTRLPPATVDADATWGTELTSVTDLLAYWRDQFDWSAQQSMMNQAAHHRVKIEDLDVHYVHTLGTAPDSVPILINHGWPGSFLEMTRLTELLTQENALTHRLGTTFHVVVPSLPGFGFSGIPPAAFSPNDTARILNVLMHGLGYSRYGIQGGDIGAGIAMRMALLSPANVIGVHLNYPSFLYDGPIDAAGATFDAARQEWSDEDGGYLHLQATRPLTPGYGLTDSPIGLAAWLLEKFQAWSDPARGSLPFPPDLVLANICIYWFTRTATSSMAYYRQNRLNPLVLGPNRTITVPVGVADFPYEIPAQSRARSAAVMDLRRWTRMPSGGHFAALEEPDALAREIVEFFTGL